MGLGNNNYAIYLTIANGKICRSVNAGTEGAIERTNKNAKVVHEVFYDFVKGTIKGIQAKDGNFGRLWEVELEDEGERYLLQFNYSSGYANAFLMALPNIDLKEPVTIVPKLTIEGDKKKSTLFVNQGGRGIKWAYTKDNPGNLPPMEKKKVKGQIVWDDSDKMEYLEQMVKDIMLDFYGKKHAQAPKAFAQPTHQDGQTDDEAPF